MFLKHIIARLEVDIGDRDDFFGSLSLVVRCSSTKKYRMCSICVSFRASKPARNSYNSDVDSIVRYMVVILGKSRCGYVDGLQLDLEVEVKEKSVVYIYHDR